MGVSLLAVNDARQFLRHVAASQPRHYPWIRPNPTPDYRPEQGNFGSVKFEV